MRRKRIMLNKNARPKRTLIKTSILELMQELSRLTRDDSLVIAAVKNIFASYNVRLSQSSARVRLIGAATPMKLNPQFAFVKGRSPLG